MTAPLAVRRTASVSPIRPEARRALISALCVLSTVTILPRQVAAQANDSAAGTPMQIGEKAPGINSVDTVVNDMKLMNDLPLRGYEHHRAGWYVGPGYTYLGNDARMTNAPRWFKDAHPQYVNGNYLRAFLPWLVIYDGQGHAASNTRVHFRNMRAYYKSRSTGEWRSVGMSPGVTGYDTAKSWMVGGTSADNKRVNDDGSTEIKPPGDTRLAWHGWWNSGRAGFEPTDVEAWFVTVQARLTVDDWNRWDDREQARYLIQVGADYYYDSSYMWTISAPGVGTSRSKRVTNDWQAFNLFTFSDVGVQEPGGGITEAAFRANPPPLE